MWFRLAYVLILIALLNTNAWATTITTGFIAKSSGPNSANNSDIFQSTAGNIGVGSISPGQKLDVQGTARFSGSAYFGDQTTTTTLQTDSSGYFGVFPTGLRTGINTNNPVAALDVESGVLYSAQNLGVGTWNPSNLLSVTGGASIGEDVAAPTNGLLVNGNVGIGSVTPGQKLDIQGTARMTGFTLTTGAAAGSILMANSVGVGTWIAATAVGGGGATSPGGISSQLQYNNAGSFGGITNSAVTATGNIGLGTTLNANKLDIQGGVGIGSTYAGYFAAPSNGMLIQGNIGIGTVTPAYKLQSEGAAAFGVGKVGIGSRTFIDAVNFNTTLDLNLIGFNVFYNGTTRTRRATGLGGWYWQSNTGTTDAASTMNFGYINPSGTDNAGIFTLDAPGVANTLRLASNGFVGIGTGNPQNNLSVVGKVAIGSAANVGVGGPANGLYVQGNVGIGTINPPNPLYVIGTPMFTTGINVGIGTASPTRLCVANNAVLTCP